MTRERAQVLWNGMAESAEINGRIIVPPSVLEELVKAGFYVAGDLDLDALDRYAWNDGPLPAAKETP